MKHFKKITCLKNKLLCSSPVKKKIDASRESESRARPSPLLMHLLCNKNFIKVSFLLGDRHLNFFVSYSLIFFGGQSVTVAHLHEFTDNKTAHL